ncbi:hypothetical protein [Streptomyces viridosporus]|uniref:hypothetical protein n=1 Tax=Streptomyces viridosporus TaxID=67581 RepID=UPI0036FAEBAC
MPLDLPTAQSELDDARAVLAALEEQVRDGGDVTPQQLADQRELIAFAELRVEAAERAEKKAAAEALDARARAAGEHARTLVAEDATEPLIDAAKAVMDAVRDLMQVAGERNATIRQVAAEGARVNEELGSGPGRPWPTDKYGYRASTNPGSVRVRGEGHATVVPGGRILGVALAAALVGQPDARRSVLDYVGGIPAMVAKVATTDLPGLADALRLSPEEWEAIDPRFRYEASAQGRRPVSEEVPA